jgi:hypothetical protein
LPPRFAIGRAKAKPRWGCTFASLEANPFLTLKKYESMHEQTYFLKTAHICGFILLAKNWSLTKPFLDSIDSKVSWLTVRHENGHT